VEKVLLNIDGLEPHYQIVVDRPKDQLDKLEVWVEADSRYFEPVDVQAIEELRQKAEAEMAEALGIHAEIKLMGPHTIERSLGKAKRVVDKRDLYKS
jgi:phenylacetate-CoA ligase